MNRLALLWDRLRTSFWFVPMLIVLASAALATLLVEAHAGASALWLSRWPRLFGAGADGARGMLSTIAGSMMTVVGVTFSMTLVALALASAQYTSRILRNFMRDRVTQVVLGIFAGIFVYCLIVLRTIRGGVDQSFVPGLAVSMSVVLATGGIGVLIYFIHHVASSIQASSIIAAVAVETLASVDRLYPETDRPPASGEEQDQAQAQAQAQATGRLWQAVRSTHTGYIGSAHHERMLALAASHQAVVRMEHTIGDFVVEGTAVVSVDVEGPLDDALTAGLCASLSIEPHRTLQQDCAFGIRQLVDIALRALSPSTNDSTTAAMCVDYLSAILARLAVRSFPDDARYEAGQLRLLLKGQRFAELVGLSFDQICQAGAGNAAILIRVLGALETIASMTHVPDRRLALSEEVEEIAEVARRSLEAPRDRSRLDAHLVRVRTACSPHIDPVIGRNGQPANLSPIPAFVP